MLKLCNQIYSSGYKTITKLHMYNIIPSHNSKTASFFDHVSNMSYISNLYYSYNSVLVTNFKQRHNHLLNYIAFIYR